MKINKMNLKNYLEPFLTYVYKYSKNLIYFDNEIALSYVYTIPA